jgi:hypothetical protein
VDVFDQGYDPRGGMMTNEYSDDSDNGNPPSALRGSNESTKASAREKLLRRMNFLVAGSFPVQESFFCFSAPQFKRTDFGVCEDGCKKSVVSKFFFRGEFDSGNGAGIHVEVVR